MNILIFYKYHNKHFIIRMYQTCVILTLILFCKTNFFYRNIMGFVDFLKDNMLLMIISVFVVILIVIVIISLLYPSTFNKISDTSKTDDKKPPTKVEEKIPKTVEDKVEEMSLSEKIDANLEKKKLHNDKKLKKHDDENMTNLEDGIEKDE